ncbi:MAG: hypothetical protein ACD_61C00221G0004 [uncultured bacterium]|nr:MAG: hypothetical protein ACD_61C00221G0004 [uncultured bacterium]
MHMVSVVVWLYFRNDYLIDLDFGVDIFGEEVLEGEV